MDIESLLSGVSQDLLTEDVKNSIRQAFDEAVEQKAQTVLSERMSYMDNKAEEYAGYLKSNYEDEIQSLRDENEHLKTLAEEYGDHVSDEYESEIQSLREQLEQLEESANEYSDYVVSEHEKLMSDIDDYSDYCQKTTEQTVNSLDRQADSYIDTIKEQLEQKISDYLDRAVDEFAQDASEQLCHNVDKARYEAITEAYSHFALLAGVEVNRIVEATDETSVSAELEKAQEENDKLVEENIELDKRINELEDKVDELMRIGIIKEMSEGLSIVEADKFERLAEHVEFTKDGSYIDALKDIRNSISEDEEYDDDDEDEDEDGDDEDDDADKDELQESYNKRNDYRLERLI